MKKMPVIAAMLAAGFALAAIPRFAEPVLVNDNGTPIDVGYYGAPQMFDWDRDGKKDLVVGQFTSGMVRFYPNVGENADPEFNGFSYIQADGQNIQLPSG